MKRFDKYEQWGGNPHRKLIINNPIRNIIDIFFIYANFIDTIKR